LTNANPLVAPTFSISRMMGTNPIAVAIPAMKHPPFVADFATTPVARGKLAVAEKKSEKVPFGFVQDKTGEPSDDPTILKSGGSMLFNLLMSSSQRWMNGLRHSDLQNRLRVRNVYLFQATLKEKLRNKI
ncbi:MAG: Ldh family oxidoreductase, partial [Bacteroidales bacterium]|nr:Ldh family oxidoreductase [Bacteroidales bacterium]